MKQQPGNAMINNPGAQGKPMQPVPGGWVDIGAQ